jgi:hypothetical protein
VFITALAKRWRSLLGCSLAKVNELQGKFITLWQLVNATVGTKMTPRMWMRDHWALQVVPLVKLMRELQAQHMRAKGQTGIAKKIDNLAAVPTEQLGWDVQELAEKFALKRGRDADDDDAEDEDEDEAEGRGTKNRRRRRHASKKGTCRTCGVRVTPKPGQSNKDWFTAHNASCKGKV